MAVKPALEEIADQSIKKLLEDPESYKETPEYLEVQQQLDDQLKKVIENADLELHTRFKMAERTCELERNRVEQSFQVCFLFFIYKLNHLFVTTIFATFC